MADDFLNTTSTTGRLSVGGTSSGSIEVSGDTDWFRISLVAGQTYQFDLRGSPSGNGTLSDPYMSLRNSSGSSTRLAEDDDAGTGNDSRFTYTATTTGDHFVAAGSSDAGIGTFQITTFQTARPAPMDDIYRVAPTAGTALNVPYAALAFPDLDVYYPPTLSSTSVVQGDSVTLSYRVSNFGAGASGSSTSGIYVSTNSTITTSDSRVTTDSVVGLGANVGSNETATFSTAGLAAGTYYVGAIADYNGVITESDETNNPSTGVMLTVTATSDAGNTRATATALTLGNPVSQLVGVSPDSDDYFTFTAASSGMVTANLTGLSADINLRALNSSGWQFAAGVNGGTASESFGFNVVANQTYYLHVDPNLAVSSNYSLATSFVPTGSAIAVSLPYNRGHQHTVTQGFNNSTSHTEWLKWGVDFNFARGENVLAIGTGRVVSVRESIADGVSARSTDYDANGNHIPGAPADPSNAGYGNYITVLQSNGLYVTYAHFGQNAISVNVTDIIEQGQVLGQIGWTGVRTEAHLHLQFGTTSYTSGQAGGEIADGRTSASFPAYFTAIGNQTIVAGAPGTSNLVGDNNISPTNLANDIYGTAVANTINALGGNDFLNGGLGNDILTGGAGRDTFVFNTALSKVIGSVNVDTITDFNVVDDAIHLSRAIFTTAGSARQLVTGAFNLGASALQADDRIIYDSNTGALIYDSNGNVAGGDFQFATLSAGLLLTAADFFLF